MDYKRLEQKIEASGLKKKFIAEKMNLSYQGLHNKLTGKHDFTRQEVATLSELLGIKKSSELEAIFFN